MTYTQAPPFTVQLELTEGCNLRCWFCGIQGITEKQGQFKFLSTSDAAGIARALAAVVCSDGWNPRIELAMHGEPTMNPNWVEVISMLRAHNPDLQLMLTSNGGGLLRKPGVDYWVHRAFDAGLNIMALDDYEGIMICDKVRERYTGPVPMWEYPTHRAANPHRRHPAGTRAIVFIADISSAAGGVHATLNNHAGSAFPKNASAQGKRCAKPFRELSVRWDGHVALCCNDWRGQYRCGNVLTQGFAHVWHSPAMDAARRRLYLGRRDFGPCDGCDALSYRPGLLPDQRGREAMPAPTPASEVALQGAMADGPYTTPVPREWEADPALAARYTEAAQQVWRRQLLEHAARNRQPSLFETGGDGT